VVWLTAMIGLVADLWTKDWAFRALAPDEAKPAFGGILTFQRSLNDGALFGLGKGLVPVFILASLLAVGFILYLFACSRRGQHFLHLALGMILAGALGNLYDRTFMQADRILVKEPETGVEHYVLGRMVGERDAETLRMGAWPDGTRARNYKRDTLVGPPSTIGVVRDFIKIAPVAGREVWPWVFNVADALLVAGVGMLLVGLRLDRDSGTRKHAGDSEHRRGSGPGPEAEHAGQPERRWEHVTES
jgi:lipoprotein signal peptidase